MDERRRGAGYGKKQAFLGLEQNGGIALCDAMRVPRQFAFGQDKMMQATRVDRNFGNAGYEQIAMTVECHAGFPS